jgi:UDP-N-acetyl-D-mannosaminuronic acid dehydrogenase
VNAGHAHIEDPGLDELVAETVGAGRLRAHLQPQPANVTIIATPTPISHDDNHAPDLTYVMAATKAIAPVLRPGDLVILESTSPVGTTQEVAKRIASLRPDLRPPFEGEADPNVFLAYCPERIIPGQMLRELAENDRIIGGMNRRSAEQAAVVYKELGSGHLHLTDDKTAEMVKLTENAYRDVNIAFANEMSLLCKKAGLNVFDVIKLANYHPRVQILRPGPGVGGHCIAVDPWFIVAGDPDNSHLIATARRVNDGKPHRVVEETLALAANTSAKVVCLGLTYKEDVGDFRESPSLVIAHALTAALAGRVLCVDPFASTVEGQKETKGLAMVDLEDGLAQAGVVVVLVPHKPFRTLQFGSPVRLVDTVGLFENKSAAAAPIAKAAS